jgi:hypothetical protein
LNQEFELVIIVEIELQKDLMNFAISKQLSDVYVDD